MPKIYCKEECCERNASFGDFCKNHRSSYLLDSNGLIRIDRFTGKSQDYYRPDLRKYCVTILKADPTMIYSLKKEALFEWMCHKIQEIRRYEKQTDKIIKIQARMRGIYIRNQIKYRSEYQKINVRVYE